MVTQAANCVNEDFVAKLPLDAQMRKESGHAETLVKKTVLHIDANAMSIPVTTYSYIWILFERNHRHTTLNLEVGYETQETLSVLLSHRMHVYHLGQCCIKYLPLTKTF